MNQKITACAFVHHEGKVFIAKRADTKKFLPGKFELPGGHIEFGESITDGLKREFQEEFGVDIIVGDVLYAFTYLNGDEHVIEVDFLARLADPLVQITIHPEDHSEYRWVTKDELDELWDVIDPEYQAIQQGFRFIAE